MNKEKIVKELDELVRKLDEDFKIEKKPYACGDLILKVCDKWICWFSSFDKDDFNINTTPKKVSEECQRVIAKTGVIHKFYTKAVELLSEMNRESVMGSQQLAIRLLEDVALGRMEVADYKRYGDQIELKLEMSKENG